MTAGFSLKPCPSPKNIALKTIENNRKISITKEICMTKDSPKKVPRRKPNSEAGCIFENFTLKQGNSLKLLAAGTRNHGVSLPPPPRAQRMAVKFYNYTNTMRTCTDTMRTANDTQEYQFMQHERQLITRPRYFCISLNSTCFKIKIITRNIMFL